MTTVRHPLISAPPSQRGFLSQLRPYSLSALLLLGATVPALAQAPRTPVTDQPMVLDEFHVKGFRTSLAQSLEAKRNANAIVDVISAEDIGKFPETNVAEALSHIPGITVDRLFGQGERVSILGTDPALNRTLLNGQTVASADWFILDTPGRTFNYTLLAPEIVGRVEVYRTPEARIDEGSVGGTVIVHLRNPLDLRANTVSGSVGYLYNDRHEDGDANFSLMYSWKNPENTLGIALSAQHHTEHIRRDGIESYGTVPATEYDGYANPTLLANPTARGPNAIGTAFFNQDRERNSYTGTIVYKPNAVWDLQFDALYVKAKYDNINQSLYLFPARPWDTTQSIDSATVQNGIITRMHLNDPIGVYDVQYREAEVKTESYTLRSGFHGDNWNASVVAGTTEASGGTQRQLFGEFLNRGGYSYDISGAPDRPAVITWDNPNTPRDATVWETDPGWGGNLVSKPTTDEEQYGQIDFDINVGSAVKKLRFGAKYRKHETTQDMIGWSLTGVAWKASQFNGGLTPSNFLDGIDGVNDQMRRRITIDGKAMAAAIEAQNLNSAPPWRFFDQIWSVKERVSAVYTQADFGADRLSGNVGIRYVDTTSYSDGNVANTSGVYSPVTSRKSYDNVLGSLNLAYELGQDTMLRFGASQVIARPNYADMTPYVALNDTVRTGDGGNPALEPYKSNNYDLSFEWYLARDSIFAATLFYKDIQNYILRSTAPEQHFDITTNQANQTYQLSRPRNAGTATSKGFSLAYQQSIAHGFGLLANYTYVSAGATNGQDLPFSSKNQVNIGPYYENDKVTVRVNYGWRSEYFTNIDRGDMMYTDAYTDVSASLAYRITKNVSLNLDAMNLLDESYFAYANTPRMPRGEYKSGRRLLATARFNF